jgi:hypothetical protein
MTLTVTVNDQPAPVGPFALVQGAAGRVVKCL